MRKVIITVVVVAALFAGYKWVSKNARLHIGSLEGKTDKVRRGDLVVPINASGNIKPASVTQIKGKASGEVTDIPFALGAMVKKGDILLQLDPVDEKISEERAKSDYERAQIQLENAKIVQEQREKVDRPSAVANLEKAEAQQARAKVAYEYQKGLKAKEKEPNELVSETIWTEVTSAVKETGAQVKAAQAEVDRADIMIRMAGQDILTAKEGAKAAKKTLEDAEQRLKETQIFSPIDGMILSRNVQKGEVVQSGKTMFTGGTVLMEIADVSEIFAVVNVDEADIGQVRLLAPVSARPGATTQPATLPAGVIDTGEEVEVTVESFKEDKFHGSIERISPQSENLGGVATFKVWIRITSSNRDKLVGLLNTQAEAHFTARSVRDALLVSYDAIQKDPNGEGYGVNVPVHRPDGKAEWKFVPCKFGGDNGIDVEVREGLKVGDVVYTKLPQKTEGEKEAEEKNE